MYKQTNTPSGLSNYEKMKKDIHKTFTATKSESNLKIELQKKRILNALSQMDDKQPQSQFRQQSQPEIAVDLCISTKNAILEHIKVLEPTDKNLQQIEKNLDKLFSIQEELENMQQSKEVKQLLWKVEMKITQQTNLTKSNKDDKKCQICFDKDREYVVVPCGHYIYCDKCKELIKGTCLMCRKQVTSVLKVYQ